MAQGLWSWWRQAPQTPRGGLKNWYFHTPPCSKLAPLLQGGHRKVITSNVQNFWPALYSYQDDSQDDNIRTRIVANVILIKSGHHLFHENWTRRFSEQKSCSSLKAPSPGFEDGFIWSNERKYQVKFFYSIPLKWVISLRSCTSSTASSSECEFPISWYRLTKLLV